MKIGDKYVDVDDMETLVVVQDILNVMHRAKKDGPVSQNVQYCFEGTEKKYTLPKDHFEELYRPYAKLDKLLKEITEE